MSTSRVQKPTFNEFHSLLENHPAILEEINGLIEKIEARRGIACEKKTKEAINAAKNDVETGERIVGSPVDRDGKVTPQEGRQGRTRLEALDYKKMINIMVKLPADAFEKRDAFAEKICAVAGIKWESYLKNQKKNVEDDIKKRREIGRKLSLEEQETRTEDVLEEKCDDLAKGVKALKIKSETKKEVKEEQDE